MAGRKTSKNLIILTGGAGFIGSCFLKKLNQTGETNILVVDELGKDEKWKNLVGKGFNDYVEKDFFLDLLRQGKITKQVKAVFHIGACSSTTETNASYLYENNYEYSKSLATWSLNNKIPFYYASSAATYGDGEQGYLDDDKKAHDLKPLNMYGFSKQLFDLWLIRNNLTSKVVGFKYFNVFGPNEYHKGDMRSLVVKAFQQIKRSNKIGLFKSYKSEYADGEQLRDFIYIKDVIDLMYLFYKAPKVKGIYNIGTGKARTWNDLAFAIFSSLKLEPKIEYIEMPLAIRDKYQYFTQADLTKLRKTGLALKFTSLEKAVSDYVVNYLEKDFSRY